MTASLPALQRLAPGLTHGRLLARLLAALAAARGWLRRLDQFRASQDARPDPESVEDELLGPTDKFVVETAQLVLLASRVPGLSDEVRAAVQALAGELDVVVRSGRARLILARVPHTALSGLGAAHIFLSRAGVPDRAFDAVVRSAVADGYVDTFERIPVRAIERRWVQSLLDGRPAAVPDDLIQHSILVSRAHPIYMSIADAYVLTHAVWYVSDFGASSAPSILNARGVAALVDAAMAWRLVEDDYDLLCELLMDASVLRSPWSPYARLAWHLLERAWDEMGYLPGASFDESVHAALEGDAADAYAFWHCYHTSHVAGMLCALLLRHPESGPGNAWEPPGCRDPAVAAERERADGSLRPYTPVASARLSALGSRPALEAAQCRAWVRALADTPLANQELLMVLLDASLIRDARRYRLECLADGLADVMRLGIPASPTTIEAASFLARQHLVATASGENPFSSGPPDRSDPASGCLREIAPGLRG